MMCASRYSRWPSARSFRMFCFCILTNDRSVSLISNLGAVLVFVVFFVFSLLFFCWEAVFLGLTGLPCASSLNGLPLFLSVFDVFDVSWFSLLFSAPWTVSAGGLRRTASSKGSNLYVMGALGLKSFLEADILVVEVTDSRASIGRSPESLFLLIFSAVTSTDVSGQSVLDWLRESEG